MSTPTTISTDKAPAAVGPYSQACAAGGMVFVSGQLGMNPATGAFAQAAGDDDDFKAQARQAMRNLQAIVEASGSDLNHVIAVDVFITDMARFKDFNAIYSDFFIDHKPARAAIEVGGLPLGGLVEVKCVATAS